MSLLQLPALSVKESTSCGSLLQELQALWSEIGENDLEKNKMILQLQQECLDVYKRKVDQTRKHKADLHEMLAEGKAEISNLASILGECVLQEEKPKATLKAQVSMLNPLLEELRQKREVRGKEFSEVQLQIAGICAEIAGNTLPDNFASMQEDEHDLTIKRLDELKAQLLELQKDKSVRLQKVNIHVNAIYKLSSIMSIDFNKMLTEVHPSFCNSACDLPKSISDETLARLAGILHSLKEEQKQRLHKIQNLGSTLIELWSLMNVTSNEQKVFNHVTSLISSSAEDLFGQGCLAIGVIEQAKLEVQRLNVLKASKMKELVFKKQNELEEILRGVHIDVDGVVARQRLTEIINSGNTDLSELLSSMDDQIAKAIDHSLSRKEILEKVDKWKFACEEASWLDEYEMDQNRYNAGRGAHKNLKRAEKARILVNKIPSMVENLIVKVEAWESEKGMKFLYNKVPLLGSLEEYSVVSQQRENEKRRSREQKRHQEQFVAEQDALFGMKPSPMRQVSARKPLSHSSNFNTMAGTPTGRRVSTPYPRHGIISSSGKKESGKVIGAAIPINYVSLPKG